MARPHKLTKYSQEEVRQKVVELGGLKPAAQFYGVATSTVGIKVGNFCRLGVKPNHIKEIKELSTGHTMKSVGEILGYTRGQIYWAAKSHGIEFKMAGKPRSNSRLSQQQMDNMDLIVKNFDSVMDCAKAHNVCSRTIDKHIQLSKRKREAAHSNNQAG